MSVEHWNTVESVFHDALAQPVVDRANFIRQRVSDPTVIREIESLLAAHEDNRDLPSLVGKRLGPYRVVREIGRGGMGAIYLGVRDDDAFRKEVAIKVIKRGMDTDAIIRRFRNERQILADLDHSNIARLLDGGTTDDGLPFFVMEFIDGVPLDVYCRQIPLDDVLRLFARVCHAVDYAHRRGVIHRDLKPSNILVTNDGAPKLLDFGIAKVLDTDSIAVTTNLTAAGQHVLTPAYASPEQRRGEHVTPASDVYSLGVILYELLTGRLPAEANVRRVSVASGNRALRGNVDAIVHGCLNHDPTRRYASAGDLARDLERHLEGDRVGMRGSRRRSFSLMIAAALLVAITIASIPFALRKPAARPVPAIAVQNLAVLPFRSVGGHADDYVRIALTDGLITKLGAIRDINVRPTSAVAGFDREGIDPVAAGRQLRVDAVIVGRVAAVQNRWRVSAELLDVATRKSLWSDVVDTRIGDVSKAQSAIIASLQSRLAATAATRSVPQPRKRTVDPEAETLYWKARFLTAKTYRSPEDIEKAVAFLKKALAIDPQYALAWAELARCHELASALNYVPPVQALPAARDEVRKALALDDTLSEGHGVYASIEREFDWNWAEAERHYRIALQLNPGNAAASHQYAEFLSNMGRADEALTQIHRAQAIDPMSINSRAVEALLWFHAHRYDKAIEAAQATLEMDANSYIALMYLTAAYGMRGDYDRAISACRRGRALSGGFYPDVGMLAHCYARAGRWREYNATLQELQVLAKKSFVDPFTFAVVYAAGGNNQKAMEWLERAYESRSYWMSSILVNPHLDPLHNDPRFRALAQRLHFPATAYTAAHMAQ